MSIQPIEALVCIVSRKYIKQDHKDGTVSSSEVKWVSNNVISEKARDISMS